MSNVYVTEPPAKGKVIFDTSMGQIEVELWSKECPKTCRVFLQLCMEGFYENAQFRRLIQGFIIQGGNKNPIDALAAELPVETHSRLKFIRRGLLGWAGTKQEASTDIFFTLDRADELTGKHSLFGRVVGDTVFNVVKMGEVDVKNDAPLYPITIKSINIVNNPFEDIVPRITREERMASQVVVEEKPVVKVMKKNTALLSFEDDVGENVFFKPKKTVEKKPVVEPSRDTEKKRPVSSDESDSSDKETISSMKKAKLDQINSEIASLTASFKKPSSKPSKATITTTTQKSNKFNASDFLESQKRQLLESKRATKAKKGEDDDLLSRLNSFTQKIRKDKPVEKPTKKEGPRCQLHNRPDCESCKEVEAETEYGDKSDEQGFLAHSLHFPLEAGKKDVFTPEDYLVLDPRTGTKLDLSAKAITERKK